MKSKNNTYMIAVIMLFLPIAGGAAAYFTFTKLNFEETVVKEEPTTRFYVTNVSEIIAGKPAQFKITIENLEGITVQYTLKVKLEGGEVHDQKILAEDRKLSEVKVSLTPVLSGDYQKIEFLLYKNDELYRTRVLQILPAIDYSQIHDIIPPSLKNGNMENSTGWNFTGKKFSGSYTSSEWRTGQRSYQMKVPANPGKGAFGSIAMDFSSNDIGLASLSFDVKSDNASYYIQSVVNDNVIWENSTGKNWTKIKAPVFLKKSNRIELKVMARNDTISNITVWWDNIGFENYSSVVSETPVEKIPVPIKFNPVIVYNYSIEYDGNSIVYSFESGEKLTFLAIDGNVSEGNALYTTSSNGDKIVFLGELYEKVLTNRVNHLYPIIPDIKEKRMVLNETLKLKNNYAITLESINTSVINNSNLKLAVIKNNRTKEFFLMQDIPLEYREEGGQRFQRSTEIFNFYEYNKKHKKFRIIPTSINESEAVFNITQYGSKKIISPGDIYGEFKIVNITQDSIVMKNILPINLTNLTARNELLLMKGKIKIKVEK